MSQLLSTIDSRTIASFMDYTLLDENVTDDELNIFCLNALKLKPAAICVFSKDVPYVKNVVESLKIASVACEFPLGDDSLDTIRKNILLAAERGSHEIDVVLEPKSNDANFPGEEERLKLQVMRDASNGFILKVIIETPLLSETQIRSVTKLVLQSGADFVKSCTGKRGPCTIDVARIFAEEVSEFERETGKRVGLKLSGGIRSVDDAIAMLQTVYEVDKSLVSPDRLRLGSSSLANNLMLDM